MRKIIILTIILAGLVITDAIAADATFETGLMFNTWKDDDSGKGFQYASPILLSAEIRGVQLDLLNAFVYTWVKQQENPSANLGAFLDTKLNASYQLDDAIPASIVFGFGMNIPTGTTDLTQKQLLLVQDPDLMPFTSFGEGFNVNPYISVSKQWEKLAAGVGAGFVYRGKYDFSSTTQEYKPGDIFTISANAGYDFTDSINANIFIEYAYTGTDKVRGNDYYKEGDLFVFGIGAAYTRPSWRLDVNLASLIRNKSSFLTVEQELEPEAKNSHGIEYDAAAAYRYFLNDRTAFGAGLDVAFIGKNSYLSDSPYFIGNRIKAALKAGIDRTFTDKLKGNTSVELYSIKEERDWEHPDDSRLYYGGTLTASVSYVF